MSVAVMTDTNSGLTPAQAKELGVYLLPMPFIVDGTEYFEEMLTMSISPSPRRNFMRKCGPRQISAPPSPPRLT